MACSSLVAAYPGSGISREGIAMNRKNGAAYLAEFIGTYFMVFLGCGAIVLAERGGQVDPSMIPFALGGTVGAMIYAVGHISGAHFNPAVTIAFWADKKLAGGLVPGYLLAQFGGAIAASTTHYMLWGQEHSFGATVLSSSLAIEGSRVAKLTSGTLVEVLISFALMFVIMAVATDRRAAGQHAGIAIGTTVALCALVMGPLTGASMNPARSFGPALLSGNQ